MATIAGVSSAEWQAIFLLGLAASLIVITPKPYEAQTNAGRVMRLSIGTGLAAFVLVNRGDLVIDAVSRIVRTPSALVVAAAVILMGIAVADFVLGRALRVSTRLLLKTPLRKAVVPTTALALNLVVILLVGVASVLESTHLAPPTNRASSSSVTILASYELPGSVMDLVFRGEYDGFASLGEGQIVHFHLPAAEGDELRLTTVADGLEYPRGLEIIDDRLFVAELGSLPCDHAFPLCWGANLNPSSPQTGELEILDSSRAKLLVFDIEPDGSLGNRRTVLSDLPIVNTLHGVNDVVAGPDGFLYLTIGSLDLLWSRPEALDEVQRPNGQLLGTVVRVAPNGRHPEAFATGFRNVYGLAFDEDGALYGVDNSGPTVRGWRGEELLHIQEGADYGYPDEGSFGSNVRTDSPLWLLESRGSAAIEWGGRVGLSSGLLIGSCGTLSWVRLTDHDDEQFVGSPGDVSLLLEVPGCVTAIEAGPRQTVVLGAFALPDHPELGAAVHGQQPNLYVVKVNE